jgi:hypothetical protein
MAAGKLPRDRDDAAVTVAVAKQKGTNAVHVARQLEEKLDELKRDVIPDGVEVLIRRNYGETANDKVNELVGELTTAIINLDRVRKVCVLFRGQQRPFAGSSSWLGFTTLPTRSRARNRSGAAATATSGLLSAPTVAAATPLASILSNASKPICGYFGRSFDGSGERR